MKTASKLLFGLFLALFLPVLAFGQDCLPNGDMDGSGSLTAGDVPPFLACVHGVGPCPPLPTGDLNCDGWRDVADIVLELNCVFLGGAPLGPCPIAGVRPLIADPLDSIIVEPRIIFPPGGGTPYTSLKVWITNKDPLIAVSLPLSEMQTEPPAYAVLASSGPTATPLVPTLGASPEANKIFYVGAPPGPDIFMVSDYTNFDVEPPNAARKAIWEINFDGVAGPCGTVEFDSLALFLDHTIAFVNDGYERVPVNFRMGKLAVKGDIDGSGTLAPSDVVAELNCVFVGIGPCPLCPADINSSGGFEVSDVVLLLFGVFLGTFTP